MIRPLVSWAAAGVAFALVLLVALVPYRRTILARAWSLIRDPSDGSASSKRVSGLTMVAGGIAAALLHPEHADAAGVLIVGGCAALGIATNADGTTALAGGLAAIRGVLKPTPATAPEKAS